MIQFRTLAAAITCGAALMMLVGAGVGDAADAPAVTGQASAVSSSSAQLNGTIDPGGIDTFWTFQYGTSNGYGQTTAMAQQPLTGTTASSVSTEITNLQPGTTYHFRLVAIQGAAGTSGEATGSTGDDETFTTGGSGSSISTSSGNSSKHSKASLRSHTFSVRGGKASIPWGCSGSAGANCSLKMSLSARGKIGGKLKTVSCGHGTFKASTGKHKSVRVAVGSKCASLLKAASRHRLGASLKATSSSGGGLTAKVTLVS
jgi:hypothetical protein